MRRAGILAATALVVASVPVLVGTGVPPKVASAGVHTAEIFTTGVSAVSHIAHGNVDWRLFARIVVPGVIGGVCGAYLLSNLHADTARPFVLAYLMALGGFLLWRGATHRHEIRRPKVVTPLALVGGFLGYLLFHKDAQNGAFQFSGLLGSIIGAVIVLLIYRAVRGRSGRTAVR